MSRFVTAQRCDLLRRALALAAAAAMALFAGNVSQAQVVNQAVGGVAISTEGVLSKVETSPLKQLIEARRKQLGQLPGDLNKPAKLRMVSLRRLQDAVAAAQAQNQPLPEAVRYLAGLQRVEYVFVDPAAHDIVLAGPADGWTVNDGGEVVGRTNGQPVLHLDDLLVALRSADAARRGGISCSIDPTAEGLAQFRAFISKQKTIGDPEQTLANIEKALGPQRISVNGVPDSSHFAVVMVAADFRMKRLAMNFEPAPVKGMPSYLEMIGAGPKVQNMLPRWWLAANYEPLLKDEDGLAWQLRGVGVKCMTEEDYVSDAGDRKHTGKAGVSAQKWADTMTAKYAELSAKDSVFGELRNCMDLAVIASLIMQEHMDDKADLRLTLLEDGKKLPVEQFQTPKQVDSKASMIKKGHNYLISASGGVQFQPWAIIRESKVADSGTLPRAAAKQPAGNSWWWDANG